MFKVGDKVKWESQAAASWTIKRGKIVAIVPKGISPRHTDFGKVNNLDVAFGRTVAPNYRVMFDGWPRNHESYLVEVPGGKTSKAMPRLYWPFASKLKLEDKDG